MNLLKESLKDFFETRKDRLSFGGVFLLFFLVWIFNYNSGFVPKIFVSLKDEQVYLLVFFFLFYTMGAFLIYPIVLSLYGKLKEFKSLILPILGIVFVLTLVSSARMKDTSLLSFLDHSQVRIGMLVLNYISNIAIYLALPLFWLLSKKDSEDRFLGLDKPPRFGEVLFLLGIMIIPIALASFSLSFLSVYPRFANRLPDGYLDYPPTIWIILFELTYAVGFASLETFFRGYLVFPFSGRFGSKPAVLAMAFLYGLLHFTKPMFEALGSFFGGFVLGLISYRTKSVYAGILIHIGVAWAMELFATLQFLYFL
ncbi:CPBP family intramembrane metalloprotease [Leptospira wolffii]|uniref:CPBP family intramembrane glutamic endopeptidase n=1 Tax=Leptospira wolffii TaxID=409998 RepID=UPI00108248FB|nr:CPBP family intramembrane glutamic endopeptidase [Leptospira wolffii]TGK61776.1 CPBP family intramembrane metalloprotease [Leptospira wolffii]TGK70319.1 CPBP family intramembrane metalloprotease [Leptospira wolffii]TGK74936.1 CPBP family intramembrane metalloprotease [Leptospira wolffii]TGL30905.1 CPBP family intramembrane metalloprotease [Leptospira wolffii]